MNRLHAAIVAHIRSMSLEDALFAGFATLTDEQMIRQMFSNYRAGRGLRLSFFGHEVMRRHFRGYEIKVPSDETINAANLLFLDSHAKMPYFLTKDQFVVFDHLLAVKLRLVDGRLTLLTEIESELPRL